MTAHWIECKLGDVITLQRGFDLPARTREEGKIPIVSSSGITGYHSTAKVKAPGVVTGRYGTLGEVFYIETDFHPLNTTLYVRDFKGNHPRFISYFLRTLNFANQNIAGAVPGVNRNALHLLSVKKPSLSVQRRIAAILSAYDDLIENNTRRIQILEEMARRIYEEWFVQFRFPGHENIQFIESEQGLIPKAWEVKKLKDIADIKGGKRLPKGAELVSGRTSHPYIRGRDIRNGRITFEEPVYVTEDIFQKIKTYLVDEGDICITIVGNIGDIGIVPKSLDKANLTENAVKLINLRKCLTQYLKYSLLSPPTQAQMKNSAAGAAQPKLGIYKVSEIDVLMPPIQLQTRWAEIVEPMMNLSENLITKNRILRHTRDFLLPKLISGEIDVSNFSEPVSD